MGGAMIKRFWYWMFGMPEGFKPPPPPQPKVWRKKR